MMAIINEMMLCKKNSSIGYPAKLAFYVHLNSLYQRVSVTGKEYYVDQRKQGFTASVYITESPLLITI
jgi:hypothetical protein